MAAGPCLRNPQACLQACLQAAGMPARRRHAAGMPQGGGAPAPSLGGGLSKALPESSKRLSKHLRGPKKPKCKKGAARTK